MNKPDVTLSFVPGTTRAKEVRYLLNLALPVIVAELGWMAMGVVDTIMVGRLGPTAIGAVSLGNAIFDVAAVFGLGLVLGLDTYVSQAFGAGRRAECDDWLWQGVWLALLMMVPLMAVIAASVPLMNAFGVQAAVLFEARPYIEAMIWSLPALLLYFVLRRYLQGIGKVRAVMFALLSANLVNAAGNKVLGEMFGIAGVGWSTCLSRAYMVGVLALYTVAVDRQLLQRITRPRLGAIRSLLALGIPAGGQILLEVGVFATATLLAGKLQTESLAAHHIVLNIAGSSFMVPLGISSAAAVAVGHAIGEGDPLRARRLGWMAVGLAVAFMSTMALVMFLMPELPLRAFTQNTEVLAIAVPLLFVAAVFQIFDGIQVAVTGAMRGSGDTRTPMYANLVAHWLLGLPAGYYLCFYAGMDVVGIWTGLSAGLVMVGSVLLFAWWRSSPRLAASAHS
ncbi:MAG TPA: MATE family efflux transporter [Bryobacteraceae bacterium]|nr:MATE family efflux transporter [Bryobacteraceae bacterium]